jgi:hypothetical protein
MMIVKQIDSGVVYVRIIIILVTEYCGGIFKAINKISLIMNEEIPNENTGE